MSVFSRSGSYQNVQLHQLVVEAGAALNRSIWKHFIRAAVVVYQVNLGLVDENIWSDYYNSTISLGKCILFFLPLVSGVLNGTMSHTWRVRLLDDTQDCGFRSPWSVKVILWHTVWAVSRGVTFRRQEFWIRMTPLDMSLSLNVHSLYWSTKVEY